MLQKEDTVKENATIRLIIYKTLHKKNKQRKLLTHPPKPKTETKQTKSE